MLTDRQKNIFKVAMYYLPEESVVTEVALQSMSVYLYSNCHLQIKRDSKMSLSDKISWIGGMLGLFTGFSVISGIEILYWLWFKVVLHKDEIEPVEEDLKEKVTNLQSELGKSDEKLKTLEVK